MRRAAVSAVLVLSFAISTIAQDDGFARERNDKTGAAKDALEGKTAPALSVGGWMNTDEKELDLAALKGKVVVLDFWGVW